MPRRWPDKFRDAFRGIWLAVKAERSFWVHLPMAIAVLVVALAVRVSLVEGCVLAICVTMVLAAEMFNTALEYLSREVTRDDRPGIATALDIASGAVLVTAIGAAVVGCAILGYRMLLVLHAWS
jgi:diacylglycerol kinase